MDRLLPPTTVTRRCLPALGTMKGGVVVVGNETVFDAGEGTNVNASDILEASKWVKIMLQSSNYRHALML